MRHLILGCVLAAITLAAPAAASAHDKGTIQHKNKYLRAKVIHLHGKRAPGRDIVRFGVRPGKAATTAQVHRYFNTLRAMLMPRPAATLVTTGRPYVPPAGTASVRAGGTLSAIAQCESGGNPGAIGGGGRYRGKYQFDYGTWASVGGSGDPAAAPEAEQDRRAAILYARSGSTPWPVCGR